MAAFAHDVAAQLHVATADVLQSFRVGRWRVLYAETRHSDPAFLFYAEDPDKQHYVTLWSGAAAPAEETEIRHWVAENARGIPDRLATCFAFHVTKDRDR